MASGSTSFPVVRRGEFYGVDIGGMIFWLTREQLERLRTTLTAEIPPRRLGPTEYKAGRHFDPSQLNPV